MALEDAMCLAMLLRDCGGDHTCAFTSFEQLRKDRVEKIVAEGRRRGGGKEEVSQFQSRLRNAMMKFFLGRANEKSDDWLFNYKLHWNEKLV
jgi:2-polyprenyl-6-methoxyphenol hydroxylase-like FAD-dependent oxidoreductase